MAKRLIYSVALRFGTSKGAGCCLQTRGCLQNVGRLYLIIGLPALFELLMVNICLT